MRPRTRLCWLVGSSMVLLTVGVGDGSAAAPIPPGRQHRLSISGENTITFHPHANLPDLKVGYNARFEYIVNSWFLKEASPATDAPAKTKNASKNSAKSSRAKGKDGDPPATKAAREVDLSLHSTEINYRHNGQSIVETKMSRSKFQGRLQPDSPILNVSAKDAPPRLQEILKNYDTPLASMLVDDADNVVNLKIKLEGAQRAVLETLVSIHAPMPRDRDTWEASSRLAMGQGQTAKGKLRFEKVKKAVAKKSEDKPSEKSGEEPKKGDSDSLEVIKVKVSGTLKAEGVIAGNFIKDGNYVVDGEQSYDPQTREWLTSKWSVDVDNELANQNGLTVAHTKGKMVIESRPAEGSATTGDESTAPKL